MNLETQILAVMDDRKSSNIFLQEIKKGLGYFPAFVLSFPDKNIWHFPPKEFSLHLASTRSILHTHGWESDFESRKNYTFSERANFNLYLREEGFCVASFVETFIFLYFKCIELPLA